MSAALTQSPSSAQAAAPEHRSNIPDSRAVPLRLMTSIPCKGMFAFAWCTVAVWLLVLALIFDGLLVHSFRFGKNKPVQYFQRDLKRDTAAVPRRFWMNQARVDADSRAKLANEQQQQQQQQQQQPKRQNQDENEAVGEQEQVATDSSSSSSPSSATMEEDIDAIIELYMQAERDSPSGFRSIGPSLLLDNAHVLAKDRLYEKVIDSRLQRSANEHDTRIIERVDGFLRGFVGTERKTRARLKVNYIMAGASSGRLEEAISMLSDSDELDEYLLGYIDSLVQKQVLRKGGPNAEQGQVDEQQFLFGSSKEAVEVLRMVHRRLAAQIKTQTFDNKSEVRLLAKLLAEPQAELHEELIKQGLKKVEDFESFEAFLTNGVAFLATKEQEQQEKQEAMAAAVAVAASADDSGDNGSKDNASGKSQNKSSSSSSKQVLQVGTKEKLVNLLRFVTAIKTLIFAKGVKGEEVFSVQQDDLPI